MPGYPPGEEFRAANGGQSDGAKCLLDVRRSPLIPVAPSVRALPDWHGVHALVSTGRKILFNAHGGALTIRELLLVVLLHCWPPLGYARLKGPQPYMDHSTDTFAMTGVNALS